MQEIDVFLLFGRIEGNIASQIKKSEIIEKHSNFI